MLWACAGVETLRIVHRGTYMRGFGLSGDNGKGQKGKGKEKGGDMMCVILCSVDKYLL